MSDLSTLTEVHEAKRGAAELLARAALLLQGEGATLDMFREALADVCSAKMAMQGCERAMELLSRRKPCVDWKQLIAESNSGGGERRDG